MKLVLVTASWCHWCPEMKRTLAALAEKYPTIEVEEVDADSKDGRRLSKTHGVKSLPTVLGFAAPAAGLGGAESPLSPTPFWRFVGADSLAAVERDLRRTPEGKAALVGSTSSKPEGKTALGTTKAAPRGRRMAPGGRKAAPAAGRK